MSTNQPLWQGDTGSIVDCWGEQFSYDAWGNLTTISSVSSAYNGCTQESLSMSATTKNQLQDTSSDFVYDAAGNLIHPGPTGAYTFDAENHLTSAGGLAYLYDGDGKRVGKAPANTPTQPNYLYWYGTGSQILEETDAAGNYVYVDAYFNGMLLARGEADNWVDHFFADALGNVRCVYGDGDPDGGCSDYYPFGGERPIPSCCPNNPGGVNVPFKFTGKERNSESGLDNFGARFDSSQFGRFLSPDPLGILSAETTGPESLNLYSYVQNDPINAVDPDGLDCVYVSGDKVSYNAGNCISGMNGTYVNGTIDPKSFTYDRDTGTLGFNYKNSDSGAIGKGSIGNVYPSGGASDADRLGAVARGMNLANGVVTPLGNAFVFGASLVPPLMPLMAMSHCLAEGCGPAGMAFALLPEVAALREGGIVLKEAAAAGKKGAEIIDKAGGVAQAAKEFEALPGGEKVYGAVKIKTLSDGTTATLYQSTKGVTRPTISLRSPEGIVTKIRY